jgi:hypothetical protein
VSTPRHFMRFAPATVVAVFAAGCGDQPIAPKAITGTVALAPGAYALYAGSRAAGPLEFPAAGATGAEYLVVGQFATPQADISQGFALAGSIPATAALAAPPPVGEVPAALRFHDAIRRMDEKVARASQLLAARGIKPAPAPRGAPPVVGSARSFQVCANLDCSATANVGATARVVGLHSAIYVDTLAPSGGFAFADLQALGAQFDNLLYPIDTLAFGAPSDIDGNGVVIILFTSKVNALVGQPQCQTSFVTGFFLAADLAPATRASYNNGEVFYALVPDPAGTVSCSQSVASVKHLIPPTFIHEFQHMISFNQHVLLRGGLTETLWLNEAMSHIAEELGGRHYDSLGVDSTASHFLLGDLYNANLYLGNPAAYAVITETGPDELAQRGGEWLFLRYLVDRFGGATTQRLEQTALTGDANVSGATGTAFATLLGRWALALYVSDLPAFTPDSQLTYTNWTFRTTYASLNRQDSHNFPRTFPLVPLAASGGSFALNGTINSGSGAYVDIVQPALGARFTVTFTQPGGASLTGSGNPQLAIVRIR